MGAGAPPRATVRDKAPDSGSALPDMAHVAYDLKRYLEKYEVTTNSGTWRLTDAWRVTAIDARSQE